MLRSFIVRVYRPGRNPAQGTPLRGVVENASRQQRSFRSIDELARILETDEASRKANQRRNR